MLSISDVSCDPSRLIWSGFSPLTEKSRAARSDSAPPHFNPRDISSSFRTSRPRDSSCWTDVTKDKSTGHWTSGHTTSGDSCKQQQILCSLL
ncbi:hypothetical protein INR49_008120 [Caranx melampygus]|nr:hypothetical protein INR49_008120 [Caranx melampygus]